MYWLKLGTFIVPFLACAGLVYTNLLPTDQVPWSLAGAAGFLFGGILASTFHEAERWFDDVSTTFGSASFASAAEVAKAKLYRPIGVLLGRHNGRPIRLGAPGHVLTLAPTRSGKGTCGVIPNLLEYPGSTITVDIKGENAAIAGRRRRDFGPVYKFAPFDVDSCRFNPMDFIRGGADAWEDAAMLADMLIVPSGSGKALFFENEARALLTGLILYIKTEAGPERRNLCYLRRLLMTGEGRLVEHFERMKVAAHPVVRRTANAFVQKEDKLKSSIMAEAQSQTLVFDSERVDRVTSQSDFTFESLKDGTASVFLVIPPELLDVYRPLVRLMLGIAVRAMSRNGTQPNQDVLFLVDEFPALGQMQPLRDGLAYLAGYGCKLWLFAQDLGQIEDIYGRQGARSIIANANLQAFSTMDLPTAEMLSRLLGSQTMRTFHKSKSRHSWLLPDYDHFNVSESETSRPLFTPDEIRCLGDNWQLLFLKGLRPILARKVPYYEQRHLRGLWDTWHNVGGQRHG